MPPLQKMEMFLSSPTVFTTLPVMLNHIANFSICHLMPAVRSHICTVWHLFVLFNSHSADIKTVQRCGHGGTYPSTGQDTQSLDDVPSQPLPPHLSCCTLRADPTL